MTEIKNRYDKTQQVVEAKPSMRGSSRRQLKYLTHSVMLEEAGPPRVILSFVMIVAVFVALSITWAVVTPVTSAARTTGIVAPSGPIHKIQHLEGGIVRELHVHNGDIVLQGQLLARLDGASSLADLQQLTVRELSLRAKSLRLRAEITGREELFEEISEFDPELSFDQLRQMQTARKSFEDEGRVLRERQRQKTLQTSALRGQLASLADQLAAINSQREIREGLFKKGLGSKIAMLEAQREGARLRGALQDVRISLQQNESEILEASNEIQEHVSKWQSEREKELEATTAQLSEARESIARFRDRYSRLEIVAPITGIVNELVIAGRGSVLAPGENVMEIVPMDGPLIIEARIDPRDVGHLEPGQLASVSITGFDVSKYGTVDGKLDWVSATSFADEQGETLYKGRITLAQNEVGPMPDRRQVIPGMTVEASINTGTRTLFSLLIRPVASSLRYAFTEH